MLEKILAAARERGMGQSAFERWASLPSGRVSKWKSGTGEPTWDQVVDWARRFGLSLDYLADDSLDSPPAPPLSADELAVVEQFRALGLSRADATRALAAAYSGRPKAPDREPLIVEDLMPPPKRARRRRG